MQRRDESEHERARAADQRRKSDDEEVDLHIEEDALGSREPLGVPDEHRNPALGDEDAKEGAGHGEDEVCDDQQRTIRVRAAPSARRTAISPRRDNPRTRTSPAMFAQAISRTSRPIAIRTISVGNRIIGAPFGICQNGTTRSRSAASVSGRSRESEAQIAPVSAAAVASVLPGRTALRIKESGAVVGEDA